MQFLSLLAVATILQGQSEPLGELSKAEFLVTLAGLGYSTSDSKSPLPVHLTDGRTTISIVLSFHSHGRMGQPFVGRAEGHVEFDLPRTLPKKAIRDWLASEKLEPVQGASYLGGRVVLTEHLAAPEDQLTDVKTRIAKLLEAGRRLEGVLKAQGGQRSTEPDKVGRAPLEPDLKLDEIDPEDFDYLREQLHWGNKAPLGGGHGWMTGAEPLGVPVIFSGMDRKTVELTHMGTPDPQKLKRRTKQEYERIEWARVVLLTEGIHIQKRLDISRGPTVRELIAAILDFAKRVKALDLY